MLVLMSLRPPLAEHYGRGQVPAEPGRGLLRVVPLAAVVVLVLNDHVLKPAGPNALTGKLSDVAGLVFFPLLLVAAVELFASSTGRTISRPRRILAWAIVATGVAFALIKVWPVATDAWAAVLGAAQWPFAVVLAILGLAPVPAPQAVAAVTDPTDLIALPALLLAWVDGRRRVPGREQRPSTRAAAGLGPRLLPIGALIVAGLASLATGAPTGISTNVDLPIQVDLTESRPVAIRTFDVTVDASAITGPMLTIVQVVGRDPGVRFLVNSADEDIRNDRPGAAFSYPRCPVEPCTRAITLIAELTDTSTAPRPARATLRVTTEPQTPKEQVAADRVTVTERGAARAEPAPSIARNEVSGEDTLGPANPIIEHHVRVHRDPGTLPDASLLAFAGRLHLEASDGPARIGLNLGAPTLDALVRGWTIDRPIDVDLPNGDCPAAGSCDIEYVVRLVAPAEMTAPSVISWRIAVEMTIYGGGAAPQALILTATPTATKAVDPGSVTYRDTLTGRYDVTNARNPVMFRIDTSLDRSMTTLAGGGQRHLLVTYAMAIQGIEPGGPVARARPPLELQMCVRGCTSSRFAGDGKVHTVHAYDLRQCDGPCKLDFGIAVQVVQGSEDIPVVTPVPLDWTLQIEVTSWGDPALPEGAHFEVRPQQPQ